MDYHQLVNEHPELFQNTSGMLKIITDPAEISQWQEKARKELAEKGQLLSNADIGIVFQDRFIVLLRDLVEFAPGVRGGYNRLINSADLRGGQATVILPVYEGKVILLRQFRHTTRRFHYEIPRGFGEIGLPAEQNARKEISEEIKGEVRRIVNLGLYHNNTGMECSEVILFYAELAGYGEADASEGIDTICAIDLDQFEAMIRDSQITDGFTIAAYTRAKLNGLLS